MTWKERFIFLILGLALGLGQAPYGLSFLYFAILPFLAYAATQAPDVKVGFGIGWWSGFGYFGLTLQWIVEPFFVEPEVTGWMAPFALAFMAGGLAIFWGIAFGMAVRLFKTDQTRIIGLAATWTLLEFIRGNIFTGFPWGNLSYAFIDLPIMQLTAWFGIYGLMLLILLVVFLPIAFGDEMWKGAVLSFCIFAVLFSIGWLRQSSEVEAHPDGTIVRLLQPNAPQHLKWRRDHRDVFYNRQLGYSAAKTIPRPNVIIWPETSLPFGLGQEPQKLQQVADAAGSDTSVIAGIVRREGYSYRNSLAYLDEAGGVRAVYDKHHLVPFGEYFPFAGFFTGLGLQGLTQMAGSFQQGAGPNVISGGNVPDFLALICYEAIFPQYASVTGERPEWLVHITNDAWFGTLSGPYQHLVQSRTRAIEQGLPMARSANTGISAMIDPYGRVVKSLPLGTQGYLDVELPKALNKTIYARLGDMPWVILAILLMFACKFSGAIRSRSSGT